MPLFAGLFQMYVYMFVCFTFCTFWCRRNRKDLNFWVTLKLIDSHVVEFLLLLCSTFVHQKQHHIRGKPGASLLPNCIYFDLYIECNCICIIPNWQFYIGIVALGIFPHLRFIFVCSRLQLYLYHCTPFIFVYPVWVRTGLALADTFWKFIFSLNWA